MGTPVFLSGSAAHIGQTQGFLQRDFLRERIARVGQRADTLGARDVLRERARAFEETVQRIAPHWNIEANAQAEAAQIEAWQLFAINCLPADFWGARGEWYVAARHGNEQAETEMVDVYDAQGVEAGEGGGDCTTFFALGKGTLSGDAILHKNRDERDETQWCGIKQSEAGFRWAGGGDIGNLGAAFAQTANGWAGANNTGSNVIDGEWRDCALGDAHALRFFAETCATLEQIPDAVENLIAREALGGGAANAGSIWVFCDAARALVVEATSRRAAYQWFENEETSGVRTNHFLLREMQPFALAPHPGSARRLERAQELWGNLDGLASIAAAVEIGRDRDGAPHAIARNTEDRLNSVTVSTSTATISSIDPRRCQTHVRNGHPAFCPAIILCPVDEVCDSELLSGAHNNRWRRLRDNGQR